jgi:hypothetical protein
VAGNGKLDVGGREQRQVRAAVCVRKEQNGGELPLSVACTGISFHATWGDCDQLSALQCVVRTVTDKIVGARGSGYRLPQLKGKRATDKWTPVGLKFFK